MPPSKNSSWDSLQEHLDSSFLQAEEWGLYQEALGKKVHKLHGESWSCLLIQQRSRVGTYLFAPYGPTLRDEKSLEEALTKITEYGQQAGVDWVRLEPGLGLARSSNLTEAAVKINKKVVKAPKQVNPRLTRVLDLSPAEDEILAGISSSTRSLIRKNMREAKLDFKTSTDPADIRLFLDMMHAVSSRNEVYFHSDEYFKKQVDFLMPLGHMRLEFALQDGKPLACIVMHDFNQVTNYTYAASLPEARSTNASALLLWQAITNAKSRGMRRLDLFGVAPEDADSSHPWYGFSTFKRKFGGTVVERGETIDIPLTGRYRVYRALLKLSRLAKLR